MTLNAKMGFYGFLRVFMVFWRFRAARHFKSELPEINWDRHRKAAYEIFSIERRFQRSKSSFSRFKETYAREHQRAVPPAKSLFYRCWPVFRENGCR